MKMTKQELKEEVKKHEGDPLLRSQRKRMARDIVMRKSLRDVSKATFVLTNPEHFSVAIRYIKGMKAPLVIAKGQDLIAFKIREIAKEHDIIIVENKPLARTLYKTVKVGQEVPPSLYQSIIEVIRYIYQMRGKNYFERS
jgi:flagellar biosynthesis protein FlhB